MGKGNSGFTWQEFQIYYGPDAERQWQSASPDPSAERDYHKMLRSLEDNRNLLRSAVEDRGPNTRAGAMLRKDYVPLIADDFEWPSRSARHDRRDGASSGADRMALDEHKRTEP